MGYPIKPSDIADKFPTGVFLSAEFSMVTHCLLKLARALGGWYDFTEDEAADFGANIQVLREMSNTMYGRQMLIYNYKEKTYSFTHYLISRSFEVAPVSVDFERRTIVDLSPELPQKLEVNEYFDNPLKAVPGKNLQ